MGYEPPAPAWQQAYDSNTADAGHALLAAEDAARSAGLTPTMLGTYLARAQVHATLAGAAATLGLREQLAELTDRLTVEP